MLLSYETSSLTYDKIDLIHGKFIAAAHPKIDNLPPKRIIEIDTQTRPTTQDIRIFINIYGVFADLTDNFAHKYDRLQVPCITECIVDPEYICKIAPKVIADAIMEEDDFWKNIEPYKWYMLLMGEIYKLCAGNYYLILPLYDALQMEDRLTWTWRHFGNVSRARTSVISHKAACSLMVKNRNDLFIGSDLRQCEDWSLAGGSSFWWPEIDGKCTNPTPILYKRTKLLNKVVAGLRELSKHKVNPKI